MTKIYVDPYVRSDGVRVSGYWRDDLEALEEIALERGIAVQHHQLADEYWKEGNHRAALAERALAIAAEQTAEALANARRKAWTQMRKQQIGGLNDIAGVVGDPHPEGVASELGLVGAVGAVDLPDAHGETKAADAFLGDHLELEAVSANGTLPLEETGSPGNFHRGKLTRETDGKEFREELHPRDREGRFRDKFGFMVGDIVTVANRSLWNFPEQFDNDAGRLYRITDVRPDDEWRYGVEAIQHNSSAENLTRGAGFSRMKPTHIALFKSDKKSIAKRIEELRARMGEPLELPSVALRQARAEVSTERVGMQIEEIVKKLGNHTSTKIHITHEDVKMLEYGPEYAGLISGLVGAYQRLYDGKEYTWHRVIDNRVWSDEEEKWVGDVKTESPDRTGKIEGGLTSLEFAEQYRGALLRPLKVMEFQGVDHNPNQSQREQFLNDKFFSWGTGVGARHLTSFTVTKEDARENPLMMNSIGSYIKVMQPLKDVEWWYYRDADPFEGRAGTSYELGEPDFKMTTAEVAQMADAKINSLMKTQRVRSAYNAERRAYIAGQHKVSVDESDYVIDSQIPGRMYREQHQVIMEAGRLLDAHIQLHSPEFDTDSLNAAHMDVRDIADEVRTLEEAQKTMLVRYANEELNKQLGERGIDSYHDTTLPADFSVTYWHDQRSNFGSEKYLETHYSAHLFGYDIGEEVRSDFKRAGVPLEWEESERIAESIIDAAEARYQQDLIDDPALRQHVRLAHREWRRRNERYTNIEREYREYQENGRRRLLALIDEIRPMGGTFKLRNKRRAKGVKAVEASSEFFPTDWIQHSNNQGLPPEVKTVKASSGKYHPSDHTVKTDGSLGLTIHEMAHHLEKVVPGLGAAEWVFWQRRVRNGDFDAPRPDLESLKYRRPGREMHIPDRFVHKYSGKAYDEGFPDKSWEIVSMGLPALFTSRNERVVWDDQDYREFMLGVLALI